jgi:hypothetical protein
VLSLVFWAITLVVAIKYVVVVMRADNQGEGGTMALLSLALPAAGRYRGLVLIVGLAGASLFFGDAMITPAISVLSAVEGMNIVTPLFEPYIVPMSWQGPSCWFVPNNASRRTTFRSIEKSAAAAEGTQKCRSKCPFEEWPDLVLSE